MSAARHDIVALMAKEYTVPGDSGRDRRLGGAEALQQLVERRDALLRAFERPREFELVRAVETVALGVALDELQKPGGVDARPLRERDAACLCACLDLGDPELLREQLQRRDREQSLERRRQQAEPVDELDLQRIELRPRPAIRDALVVH